MPRRGRWCSRRVWRAACWEAWRATLLGSQESRRCQGLLAGLAGTAAGLAAAQGALLTWKGLAGSRPGASGGAKGPPGRADVAAADAKATLVAVALLAWGGEHGWG